MQDYNSIDGEILQDVSATGRNRPWREHKLSNTILANVYDVVNVSKASRLRDCATWLVYSVGDGGSKTLKTANFCRVRLCPICTWRRSLKVYMQTSKIIKAMKQSDKEYAYIMLTLTMRNCAPSELIDTLNELLKGFDALRRYKAFTDVVHGWYRGLEITHNVDVKSINYDTFHPHLHCLLAVNKSYFTDTKHYLSQNAWTNLWQRALKVDYVPILDVRRCKGDNLASIAEVAKYSAKSSEYILPDDWDLSVDTVTLLDKALANRRLVAFGGIMRDWHKRLNLDDEETGDLLHIDENEITSDDAPTITFVWRQGYNQYISDTPAR